MIVDWGYRISLIHGHYDLVIKSNTLLRKKALVEWIAMLIRFERDDNRPRTDSTFLTKGDLLENGCNGLVTDW